MTKNIKTLYRAMDAVTQQKAIRCLREEIISDAKDTFEESWITEEKIPELYQERTVVLFQNILNRVAK